jgi:MFS family permease
VRVAVYYVLLAAAGILLVRFFPWMREAVAGGTLGGAGSGSVFGPGAAPPVGAVVGDSGWELAVLASVSMLGALAVMLPVTWVYMLTRDDHGYDESVVHSMLILPVAVTGIVMIVKGSVALAFSLAGIVAAVRFRTSLDDTKDAVYIFLAIGVGLASGVQSLGIAVALSLVFNAVVLTLWGTRFGNVYAVTGSGALGMGDVLAASPRSAGGLPPAAAAMPDAELAGRLERHILEERAKDKEKRANSLILVHARAAESAQAFVDALLEQHAARWKLAEIGPGARGVMLVYLARLEGTAQGTVVDRLRDGGDGVVEEVELRSLKGIKPRE